MVYIVLYQTVLINIEEIYKNAYNHGVLLYNIFLSIFAGLIVYILTVTIPEWKRQIDDNKKNVAQLNNIIITYIKADIKLMIMMLCHTMGSDKEGYPDVSILGDFIEKLNKQQQDDFRIKLANKMQDLHIKMQPEYDKILRMINPDNILYDTILRLYKGYSVNMRL